LTEYSLESEHLIGYWKTNPLFL